jgi:hypothetical protein
MQPLGSAREEPAFRNHTIESNEPERGKHSQRLITSAEDIK